MKGRTAFLSAALAGAGLACCLSVNALAETAGSGVTKWSPPNVPGMPGYHEQSTSADGRRTAGNWDAIAGNWKQFSGKVKEKWGKLTDDDVTRINGKREQLEGLLQERYGYSKDQVRREVDEWVPPVN